MRGYPILFCVKQYEMNNLNTPKTCSLVGVQCNEGVHRNRVIDAFKSSLTPGVNAQEKVGWGI